MIRKLLLVPAFVGVSILIAACGSGAGDPAADVSVTRCIGNEHSEAVFVIHNHASEPAKYYFLVNFVQNGHVYTSSGGETGTVQPGGVATDSFTTPFGAAMRRFQKGGSVPSTPVTCRITDLRRTLVPNGRAR